MLGFISGGAGRGEAVDWVRVGAGRGRTKCGEGVLELFSTVVPANQDIKQYMHGVINDRID